MKELASLNRSKLFALRVDLYLERFCHLGKHTVMKLCPFVKLVKKHGSISLMEIPTREITLIWNDMSICFYKKEFAASRKGLKHEGNKFYQLAWSCFENGSLW